MATRKDMLRIDGSRGEGGGQILRTSLALSLITRQPVRIENVRAGRPKPGLMRQHLTAVRAAAAVGSARVSGDEIGSTALTFEPREPSGGDYEFSVGSAGSTTLVLQTVLPAVAGAKKPSRIRIEGGTHNQFAPPYDFLASSFLPLLARMGACVEIELQRPGFFPAGGGVIEVRVAPATELQPLELLERGEIVAQRARAYVANLSENIGHRELRRVKSRLEWPREALELVEVTDSDGPGNVLMLEIESASLTEVFTGFGRRRIGAEEVAGEAIDEAARYLAAGVPVGPYLADQLLLPSALAGGGSFRTVEPTEHSTTNAAVIREFLDVEIDFVEEAHDVWRVDVRRE